MANVLYDSYKESLLDGSAPALDSDTIKVALVDTATVGFSAAHVFYSDVVAAVVGAPATLGSKTVTAGVFDSADGTFGETTGASAEALVMYHDTGLAASSPLIGWWDTGVVNLPVVPNTGEITYTSPSGGWFEI